MSGELTPAEATSLVHELDMLGAEVTDAVDRIGGKLGGHIDWLTGRLEDRDKTIARLEKELEDTQELAAELQDQVNEMEA